MPTPRGPHRSVDGIDWDAAMQIWFDLSIPTEEAVRRIGCAERTIYRYLGNRIG